MTEGRDVGKSEGIRPAASKEVLSGDTALVLMLAAFH